VTPYADFLYFRVLLLVAVGPALVQGLLGRFSPRGVIVTLTAAMLGVQYGVSALGDAAGGGGALVQLGAFALLQWGVVRGFLALRRDGRRRWAFRAALLGALAPLVLARVLPAASGWHPGFLGLSYLTFRSLDVVFCIQDGLITRLSPLTFGAFLLFFPTVSAGPIDRYRRFERDVTRRRTREECLQDLDAAVHRVARGFLYKFILAALIQEHWLAPAARSADLAGTLSYMYAYTLYLFFDFAGYSAFAVAVSHLVGVHTPENFARPFLAPNIREFWNRWHVSLSWWFRDHVYMRVVMAGLRDGWFRDRHLASHAGFLCAMGLMGLWHGTQWQYVLYGLYHAVLLAGHDVFTRRFRARLPRVAPPVGRAVAVVVTFHATALGFLLFSGRLTGGAGGPG
jgi:membrane protein involved in D-alanine export